MEKKCIDDILNPQTASFYNNSPLFFKTLLHGSLAIAYFNYEVFITKYKNIDTIYRYIGILPSDGVKITSESEMKLRW